MGFFDLSLEAANEVYAWGWRLSLGGAVVTAIGVSLLMWGTRVRDHDFESNIGRLHDRAATSEKQTKEIETANLTLQKEVESEKIERLKLEEKLAPRSLSAGQQKQLADHLRQFSGTRVDIIAFPEGTADILALAGTIREILESAGWNVKAFVTMGAARWVKGVLVRTKVGSGPETEATALALATGLISHRLAASKYESFEPGLDKLGTAGVNGPTWDNADEASIRVEVGTKP